MVMPTVTEIRPPASRSQREAVTFADRAQADRTFSEIAGAIERGLSVVDPRAADARVLRQIQRALSSRGA